MTMAALDISLIISTYNQPAALAQVLAGVALQTHSPNEVLVADDGSGEADARSIKNWRHRLPPLEHVWHEDHGFRKAVILNEAITRASGDYVVLLDGDCVPHPRFVEDHAVLAEPGCWVQGRRSFINMTHVPDYATGGVGFISWWLRGRSSGLFKGIRWPVPWVRRDRSQRGIIGCNMGIWRSDLVSVNGFDEAFEGWGLEDSDLGNRLYHLGRDRKLVYGRAVIHHLNHRQISRDQLSKNQGRLRNVKEHKTVACALGLRGHVKGDE